MSREEALEKGILEDRIVFLRPIPKKSDMVNDTKHIAFFKMEGASDRYTLKMDDKTKRVINPFKGGKKFSAEDEMKYFSEVVGEDLNPYKKDNSYWGSNYIVVTKTPELMAIGKRFDLSVPLENLEYKVLLTWDKEIAPDWDSRFNGDFRYAFVGEDYEERKAMSQIDEAIRIGEIIGSMKSSAKKMKSFINMYFQTKHKMNTVPEDADTEFLVKELKKIIDSDKEGFLNLADDPYYKDKELIATAIAKGAITRKGVGIYTIEGIAEEYNYIPLVKQFHAWAETPTEPIYARIKAMCK